MSFLGTTGIGKHYWNSCYVKLLRFLQSYLTKWSALKMAACNVVSSFWNVFWPHANLAFLLCNANQLISLLPLLHPWVHSSLVNPPTSVPIVVPPWKTPSHFFQLCVVWGPFWPWQKLACDKLPWCALGNTCCMPPPTCISITMHAHPFHLSNVPTHHAHDYH